MPPDPMPRRRIRRYSANHDQRHTMTRFAIRTTVMFAAACAGLAFHADACPKQRFIRCFRERPRVSGQFCRRQTPRASLSPRRSTLSKEMERDHAGRTKQRVSATEKRDPQIQGVAIAGLVDVNNDGKSDLEIIRRLIQINGGQIDAELRMDGRLTGELRPDTGYVILGELPDKTTVSPRVAKQFDAFMRRANELGIPLVSLKKLLGRGNPSRGTEPVAKSIFRPRRPPQQPY